jgi:hypothetical protein
MDKLDEYHYMTLLAANWSAGHILHPINYAPRIIIDSVRDLFDLLDDQTLSLRPIAQKIGCGEDSDQLPIRDTIIII